MNTITRTVLGGVAGISLAACGGSDDLAPEVETIAIRIESVVRDASNLHGLMNEVAGLNPTYANDTPSPKWSQASGVCGAIPQDGYVAGTSADLWPRTYLMLEYSLTRACEIVAEVENGAGNPFTWPARAEVAATLLSTGFADLPDYSPAQLRRAIADRQ